MTTPPPLEPSSPPAPRISVVMPVYNAARFVDAAARSILDQTFTDLELIAVDDGSTDGSGAILDRLAANDARLRIVRRPNTGVTGALNDGIAAARAPLIARMDADDVSAPTRLEQQAAYLDAHPGVGLLGAGWNTCFADGRKVSPDASLIKLWNKGPDAIAARLAEGHNVMAHPTVIFRRAAFDAAGGHYDPAFETAEDFECWLRMSRLTQIACLPQPLLDYRIHPQSICATRGHESIDAVCRAVHAHWAATTPPSDEARRVLHRHLAQLYYSVRDRRGALAQGLHVLRTAPLKPSLWRWYAGLIVRVIKGPSY